MKISLLARARRALFVKGCAWALLVAISAISGTGCIPNSRLVYLQDPAQIAGSVNQYPADRVPYKLQTGDVLSVTVKGVDQELQSMFNAQAGGGMMNYADPANQFAQGYSVDEAGDINLPTVGRVRVKGLTMPEAMELVQTKVANYLREATVSVKMVSFKVTVLGEVKRPGYYYVTNMRCTLLEALGLGGDLSAVGNRQRVKVIRVVNGATEVAVVDLTDANLMRSPYYQMQPNDVIYVEPFSGQTPRKNFSAVNLTLAIVSGLSTITLLVLNLRKAN